ncbi:hypothetical protein [Marinobacter nitratireducens]|uniref:hypothetical protein n=1 Tax=Marinobacter nitratireducens TaxID=1137280 RepID=UPI0005644CC1|nr:hypothetical protein [Marinobacter nitratireducens]
MTSHAKPHLQKGLTDGPGLPDSRVIWSNRDACLELVEHSIPAGPGGLSSYSYEVRLTNGTVLYSSISEHSARHYIEILLLNGM